MRKITALLILLIGLLQYKLWYGEGNVREFKRLNDRIAELRQEGAKRRERNAALEAEVMDLKQGLDAVEERARHELGMIMEGEEFVQVIDPQHESEPSSSPAVEKPTVSEDLPEAAKKSKQEESQKKKNHRESDTLKTKPTQKATAKKPATSKPGNQPSQPTEHDNKSHPKAKPAPKPIQPRLPETEPQAPKEDDGQ